jgi:hypothetical protein
MSSIQLKTDDFALPYKLLQFLRKQVVLQRVMIKNNLSPSRIEGGLQLPAIGHKHWQLRKKRGEPRYFETPEQGARFNPKSNVIWRP